MAYKGILKQVQDGGPKQGKTLNETWNIAQKNDIFSFGRRSKQQENRAKQWYKIRPKERGNELTLKDYSLAAF